MDLLDRRIDDLAARRRLQRALDAAAPWTAAALLVAAVAIGVIRLAAPAVEPLIPWLAIVPCAAGLPAAIANARRRERRALLAGRLDLALEAHGLAMALAAAAPAMRDGDWSARLRRPLEAWRPPAYAWRALRPAAVAALTLVAAVAMPQAHPVAATATAIDALLAPLGARIDAADDARLLPPDQAAEPRRRLEELRARAGAQGMDQATWDGLDRIASDLDAATGAAARRLAAALVAADAAADAPRGGAGAAALAQAVAALGDLAAQAPGLVPQPASADEQALARALSEAARAETVTPEQLAALARAGLHAAGEVPLGDAERRALARRLAEELAAMRARLSRLGAVGDRDWRDLLDQLGQQRDQGEYSDHRPLDRIARDRFPEGAAAGLPPGARLNADGSVTLAEESRSADLDEAALRAASRAAARAFDPTAADARRAAIAPRHRAVVERYFAADQGAPPPATP